MIEKSEFYILGSFLLSFMATVLLIASVSTNLWIVAEIHTNQNETDSINYGLYRGTFRKSSETGNFSCVGYNACPLYIECMRSVSACAVSCKTTKDARQEELEMMANGSRTWPYTCDDEIGYDSNDPALGFAPIISAPIYNSVNVFVYFQLIFAACSTIINLIKDPALSGLALIGIVITDAVSVICGILVTAIWGTYFLNSGLNTHFAFSYIAMQQFEAVGSLGFSYWFVLVAIFCSGGSAVLIMQNRRRSGKM